MRSIEGRLPDLTAAELLAAIPDAMLMVDADWRILHANEHAAQLLCSTVRDLVGQILGDAFPEAIGTAFDHELRLAAGERAPRRFTAHYAPLGLWLAVRATPAGDGLALFLTDVTDYKRAELRAEAIADVQLVLRRVATAVAADTAPDAVHRIVCREAAELVAARAAWLLRFEGPTAVHVLGV